MELQGIAFWPGVAQVERGRYTRSLGTQPGHAILEILPQQTPFASTGTLTLSFGGGTINLPNCKVDFGAMHWSDQSGQTILLKILDRRWAWKAGGEISGRYNLRNVDGTLDTSTEKTPQELATLLLQAMGEQGFDVSALPNGPRPQVEWEFSHPATELDRLCELLGCRVCLKISTDRVVIVKLGAGSSVLPTANLFRLMDAVDVPEAPDSLKVVGGWAKFQSKLWIIAVGLDNDGSVKPINTLSYMPAAGWSGTEEEFMAVTDATDRELAKRTVWRWYQIVSQADTSQSVPGYKDVQDINNIKPIDDVLVETYEDANGITLFQKSFVEGIWFNADTQVNNNTDAGTRYTGAFEIDQDDGIVIFSEPVFQLDGATRTPAELYLTCSYYARDPDTGIRARYIKQQSLGGNAGTGPKIIERRDILYTVKADYAEDGITVTGTTTNEAQVNQEAGEQITASASEFQTFQAFEAGYNGLVPIDLDGRIRQVTFRVDSQDESPRGGAETYVSVNCETDPYLPRERQRRVSRESVRPRTRIGRSRRFPI